MNPAHTRHRILPIALLAMAALAAGFTPCEAALVVVNTGSKVRPDLNSTDLETSTTNSTLSFNAGATADILIVSLASEKDSGPYTVTYNNAPLSVAIKGSNGSSADIWYLLNPYTGGAANIVIDYTNAGTVNGYGMGVISVANTEPGDIALHITAKSTSADHSKVSLTTTIAQSFIVTGFNANDQNGGAITEAISDGVLYASPDIGSATGAATYKSVLAAGTYNFDFAGTGTDNSRSSVAASFVAVPIVVPTPAALPAGLAMIGLIAARRRRG